jgi:Periplasmic binding protein
MKISKMKMAVAALAAGAAAALVPQVPAFAQAKEQFFPVLVYRTGAYAPNGVPFANGYVDYLKMINARDGGIGGVKITFEECETGYATDKGVECYERLKGKGPTGATAFHPLSTGITFALTDKTTTDKIPIITGGYGRSESMVLTGQRPTFWFSMWVKKKAVWTSLKARKSPWFITTLHSAKSLFLCCKSAPSSMASSSSSLP